MKTTWPQAVVAIVVVAGVVALTALGRDTATLISLGVLLLTGIGLIAGQVNAVKDNTNGNMGRLLGMVEKQGEQLAQMMPPPPPPAADGDTGPPTVHEG